jgi:formylglycine-generating enzyme required for sulfatase activity
VKIFLSYSSADRASAEAIYLALHAQGHSVFFDRTNLPAGEEYDVRIRSAIEAARLFVFLISPTSLQPGSYALTELGIAQKTWTHPNGRVLPVMLHPVAIEKLPAYLRSVTILQPEGNVPASVADAVYRIGLERRRGIRKIASRLFVVVAVLCAGGFYDFTHRQPGAQIIGKDGAPAVLIAAGTFNMGDEEESPLREIFVDGFYLDKYELTVSRYARFLKATGSVRAPEKWEDADIEIGGDLPVVGVDWQDANAYCRWIGRRLPTEAEWEKAARGGDNRIYPWGDDPPSVNTATFAKDSKLPAYKGGVDPVGRHEAGKSPFGAYDLSGNVSEWVADWFAESFPVSARRNPKGPESGTGKVIRGGGWYDPAERLRITRRMYATPDNRADDLGFRCATDLKP